MEPEHKGGSKVKKNGKNILLTVSVIFLVISLCFNVRLSMDIKKGNIKLENCNKNVSKTYEYLDSMTVASFENAVAKGESMVVYIGRPDCPDCNFFEPMFYQIIDQYQLKEKIKYINVKSFKENNTQDTWLQFKSTYGFTQTPAIIRYENGKVKDMVEWSDKDGLSETRLKDWLISNQLIDQ